MCLSCLHQASNMYWPPRVARSSSCSKVRKDELVCYRSNYGAQDQRTLVLAMTPFQKLYPTRHTQRVRPRAPAQARTISNHYVVCKDPNNGAMMDAMTKAPINNNTANTKTWCEYVQPCMHWHKWRHRREAEKFNIYQISICRHSWNLRTPTSPATIRTSRHTLHLCRYRRYIPIKFLLIIILIASDESDTWSGMDI